MSGLETLLPLIYHEKQQPGSQLCAQHALNTILQGDYFSAPDLAQFAQQLDALEGSFNNDAGPVSNNMDDTGCFSVQVLEGALRVLGFTLVRWRSQDLRDQQENPHSQMAFILNHQQHWFTLRRFGSLENGENGHWFNLNSFLKEPEWVGKLYLGMVLSRAEDEGYSVFAVLPASEDLNAPRTLPHTEADDIASTLPEPTSSHMATQHSTTHTLGTTNAEAVSSAKPSAPPSGFEDEDLELQAALQASLMGARQQDHVLLAQDTSATRTTLNLPTAATDTNEFYEVRAPPVENPVAASLARNKAIMRRMQREQEMALNERYDEEPAMGFGSMNGTGVCSAAESSQRQVAQTAGEVEEAEAIQRAIEESREATGANDHGAMDISEDDAELDPIQQPEPPSLPTVSGDSVYDDDDSEPQAALKASLEGLLEGSVVPPTPAGVTVSAAAAATALSSPVPSEAVATERDDEEEQKLTVEIDAEEMRRRRLVRFAGL